MRTRQHGETKSTLRTFIFSSTQFRSGVHLRPEPDFSCRRQKPTLATREMAFDDDSFTHRWSGLVGVSFFFALAIPTLARVLRAMWESDNKLPFSRQQGFPGRAPQLGHSTSCALSFITMVRS